MPEEELLEVLQAAEVVVPEGGDAVLLGVQRLQRRRQRRRHRRQVVPVEPQPEDQEGRSSGGVVRLT